MPATAVTASTRFIMPGLSKVVFMTAVAGYPSAPTRTEINAGSDISGEVVSIEGFSSSASFVDTPDMSSTITSKVLGRTQLADSSITFYMDKTGVNDVRSIFSTGTTGFIAFMDNGDTPASRMDVFAVQVASVSPLRNAEGSDVNKVRVDFALPRTPAYRVTIPA